MMEIIWKRNLNRMQDKSFFWYSKRHQQNAN
jgi:hypothetical protein